MSPTSYQLLYSAIFFSALLVYTFAGEIASVFLIFLSSRFRQSRKDSRTIRPLAQCVIMKLRQATGTGGRVGAAGVKENSLSRSA